MRRVSFKWAIFGIAMAFLIIIGWCLPSTMLGTKLYDYFLNRDDWRLQTTPLDQLTIAELCKIFSINSTDKLCNKTKPIYAPDFFDVIKYDLRSDTTTYKDVQAKLGKYQSKLEPLITLGDGSKYFVSEYDLRGDGATSIIFFFHEDGSIMKVIIRIGSSED
jgi:hypothetical protein